ncbi:hypothetical protein LTR09_000745 [Extremus antarcticus]|uniref:Uncharacterized protein n=1 Tax=Extremus antarcticus TaxID=702011 RepID=A0AAJ0GK77_9PEZI|nr:hypothetical protein LTR09_000745 [Extremus antarcticus]
MAISAHEQLDQPDDSESDDGERAARPSEDVRRHDRETMTAEDEAERLIGGGPTEESRMGKSYRGDGAQRKKKRRRRDGRSGEEEKRELMYEMEEGGPRNSSAESVTSSSEGDMQRLGEVQARRPSRAKRWTTLSVIHIFIVAAFLALLYGAYRATTGTKISNDTSTTAPTLSNGTHTFAPTTILLSLDGFRADFLDRGITPTLNGFIRSGVSPRYMQPAFPSLTFPNHFTLVTGLHPESHGIVGNTFWDPDTKKEFYYTDPARSMTPEWWNAEPIWVSAEKQGVRSAIHMWPGSEAHIAGIEPEFNADERLDRKVQRVLHWLDMPSDQDVRNSGIERVKERRPQLIAAYVPNVDADGHKYGPNSTYIRSTIAEVDGMLASLFNGIADRNLTNVINIVVVSDHGMATTATSRLVQLEDVVDTSLIEHTDGWPLYGLRPFDTSDAQLTNLYNQLVAKSKLPKYQDAFDVYLRDKNMPAKYHFSANQRIAPLWIIPRAGWAIVKKHEFDIVAAKQTNDVYHPRGLHGYDHEHPLMRAIFVARGPAFPHSGGSRVKEFQNTEVYNIVCDSLAMEPKQNNGTIRLPFATEGKHDFDAKPDEIYDPPSDEDDADDAKPGSPPEVPNLNARPTHPHPLQPHPSPPTPPTPPEATPLAPIEPFQPLPPDPPQPPKQPKPPEKPTPPGRPVVHDGDKTERPVVHDGGETGDAEVEGWWQWVKNKVEGFKGWVGSKFGADEKSGKEDEGKQEGG